MPAKLKSGLAENTSKRQNQANIIPDDVSIFYMAA